MSSNRVTHKNLSILAFAILVIMGFALSAFAVENRPLPSFQVQNLDGSAANSSDWKMPGNWVIIYVEGRCCGACKHLLSRLTKDQFPQLASHAIVIVGGAQPTEALEWESEFTNLAEAQWFADPTGAAVGALDLHGAPVTLGLEDKTIRWGMAGVSPNPGLLPGVLKKWTRQ